MKTLKQITARKRMYLTEAVIWFAAIVAILIVNKAIPREHAGLRDAARTVAGCVQWAEQHEDEVLARKCRASAPIQELLDHVAQTRHAGNP